jgi:phosphopantothenoylcysteine decarboxylase / phosphopantothenate---cysteine ligase
MSNLHGKHIVLGVTGGIACYKAADLVRKLLEKGASLDVVMTQSAQAFVTAATFQALSGRPVYTDLWDPRAPNNMVHINLTRQADLVLIAPATANTMAKIAHGLADDLVSTLCLASPAPVFIAPAMNREMWQAAPTRRNVTQLLADGVQLLGPAQGEQACGETGDGRMLEPTDIVRELETYFQPKSMHGLNLLMTAGPTCEPIDPVRVITNRSSGKTGYAIAQAAQRAGANVTLISGPTALTTPPGVVRVDVQTAQQMYDAVMDRALANDIFIAVAAVADWRVENVSSEKVKKDVNGAPQLSFSMNPDILQTVANLPNGPWCVGFAAETSLDLAQAQVKRRRKGVALLVANLAQHVMDAEHTTVELVDEHGARRIGPDLKIHVAEELVQEIARRYKTHQA